MPPTTRFVVTQASEQHVTQHLPQNGDKKAQEDQQQHNSIQDNSKAIAYLFDRSISQCRTHDYHDGLIQQQTSEPKYMSFPYLQGMTKR